MHLFSVCESASCQRYARFYLSMIEDGALFARVIARVRYSIMLIFFFVSSIATIGGWADILKGRAWMSCALLVGFVGVLL